MRAGASDIGLDTTLLQNKVGLFFVAFTCRKFLDIEKR